MKDESNVSISENMSNSVQEGHRKVELDLRTELGHKLREILVEKRLKQREIAALLAVQQPEVSHLYNGHFTRFTIDKLIQLFNRLGWTVKFQIYPRETD
ncbi:MAG: helix-turn-helix transcriptional regulator [Cyanobacteria bacterium P01_D01_bin.71]